MEEWDEGGGKGKGKGAASSGEVEYKSKAGTAWSHSYLNQKPWHPLSYPNQRRKWIAEQTHSQRQRRQEEVSREFAQEQEFFRQTALFSKREKEKVEMMKAVSFMYVRPPGYNAESAKAAEIADEKKRSDQNNAAEDPSNVATTSIPESLPNRNHTGGDKKKTRPKDVFGRPLPTEAEFEVLKNAPRLETGLPVRIKPFAVEVRNVRCVRCGTFGHQSGDRECPLKDAIMPSEESRLKRDDPLTALMAQTESSEPLKWELKQRPGMSPPRGGFRPDDPNQQIIADDIFDEYGGFLGDGDIPALLSNFSSGKSKKLSKRKSNHKHHRSSGGGSESKPRHDNISCSSDSEGDKEKRSNAWHGNVSCSSDSEDEKEKRSKSRRRSNRSRPDSEDEEERRRSKSKHKKKKRHHFVSSGGSDSDRCHHGRRKHHRYCHHSKI